MSKIKYSFLLTIFFYLIFIPNSNSSTYWAGWSKCHSGDYQVSHEFFCQEYPGSIQDQDFDTWCYDKNSPKYFQTETNSKVPPVFCSISNSKFTSEVKKIFYGDTEFIGEIDSNSKPEGYGFACNGENIGEESRACVKSIFGGYTPKKNTYGEITWESKDGLAIYLGQINWDELAGCGFLTLNRANGKNESYYSCWNAAKNKWEEPKNENFLNVAEKSTTAARSIVNSVNLVIKKYEKYADEASTSKTKKYFGIGISLKNVDDLHYPIITNINSSGPAYRAGLRNGYWVARVNNRNTYNEKIKTISNWFNRTPGDANYLRYFNINTKEWKNITLYNEEINSAEAQDQPEPETYFGIGIKIKKDDNQSHYPIITDININGPAYREGLRDGDWISQINNRSTYNESIATVGNFFNRNEGGENKIRFFDVSDDKWRIKIVKNELIDYSINLPIIKPDTPESQSDPIVDEPIVDEPIVDEPIVDDITDNKKAESSFSLSILILIFVLAVVIIFMFYLIRNFQKKQIALEDKLIELEKTKKKSQAEVVLKAADEREVIEEPKAEVILKAAVEREVIEEPKTEVVLKDAVEPKVVEETEAQVISKIDSFTKELIANYLETIEDPNKITSFVNTYKIIGLERLSTTSQVNEVILTSSKLILNKTPFWGYANTKDEFIILPGRIMSSRSTEILNDNSRLGHKLFNGIYKLKNGENFEVKDLAKAELINDQITISHIGELSL